MYQQQQQQQQHNTLAELKLNFICAAAMLAVMLAGTALVMVLL